MRAHLQSLTAPPSSLDPHNRAPLRAYLDAQLAWRTAALRPGTGPPAHPGPVAGTGAPVGLWLVVAVTLLGDVGTLFVSVSVVLNASAPAALAVSVALGTAAMFLAHQSGHWLHARQNGLPRVPGFVAALGVLAWLGIGAVAALLRVAAPLNTAGGFGNGRSNTAAITVLLAALLFVLYTGNGLAAAALGHRTGGRAPSHPGAAWRARTERRRAVALARQTAWRDALEADTALHLAARYGSPMTTDAFTATRTRGVSS